MLNAHRRLRRASPGEAGFSLVELMVVMSIMAVVLVVASGALISLSQASTRGDAMVSEEQAVSTTLADLARDIRSAHTLAMPAGATPANQMELQVTNTDGTTTPIQWVYQPGAGTLTREVLNSAGAVVSTGWSLSNVANSISAPLFNYYDDQGTDITNYQVSAISPCTTRIGVQLYVSSQVTGVTPLHQSEDVALTDQLDLLSTPGNGQC